MMDEHFSDSETGQLYRFEQTGRYNSECVRMKEERQTCLGCSERE